MQYVSLTVRLGMAKSVEEVGSVLPSRLAGLRVLAVDDNATNRRIHGRDAVGLAHETCCRRRRPLGHDPIAAGDRRFTALFAGDHRREHARYGRIRFGGGNSQASTVVRHHGRDADLGRPKGRCGTLPPTRGCRLPTKPIGEAELLEAILRVLGSSAQINGPALVTRHALREEKARSGSCWRRTTR